MQIEELEYYLEEKSFLQSFEKKSRALKIPVISAGTGMFLEFAVMMSKPQNILEIGCGNGFSTYFLVKNLQNKSSYTGIDLNGERLSSAESFIQERFPGKEMEFICGNALKVIPDMDKKFDFVFIDAAKFEYPGYIRSTIKKLDHGAMIIADNIFFSNKVFSSDLPEHDKRSIGGIKEYIKIVTSVKKDFSTSFFDIGDGLAISIYGDGPGGRS